MLFRPKKRSVKKVQKNRNLPRGLVHVFFCQKIKHFLMCFIWANQARKDRSLIFDIEKNAFWNRKVKF